jgi:coenzyme F420 hydrogenase subunit beta
MAVQLKGAKDLFKEVIDAGLCTLCGACAGSCPYLVPYKGKVKLTDDCTVSPGQCYQYCPRTYTDMDSISQHVFGQPYSDSEMGNTIQVLMATATDAGIRERAQYGGTVTTLLSLALADGLLDGVILTQTSEDKTPRPFLAKNTAEVLQCAGSSYLACLTLETLNNIPGDSKDRLGIVVTPCQALALAKMRRDAPQNRVNIGNIKLVIGLFCTWALSPDGGYQFLKKSLDLPKVVRFDIPPPPANRFDADTPSGRVSLPLEQVRKFVMPTCAYCLDMTSEFADISVGSVEGIEGWNTVIVRTKTGAELLERAKAQKKLKIDALPIQNLAHLREAALLKKKRALKEIVRKTGDRGNLLYLGLSPDLANRLLA